MKSMPMVLVGVALAAAIAIPFPAPSGDSGRDPAVQARPIRPKAPRPDSRDTGIPAILESIAPKIRHALAERDPCEARAEDLLAELCGSQQWTAALEAAGFLEPEIARELVPIVVETWARQDAGAAWQALAAWPPDADRTSAMQRLVIDCWPESRAIELASLATGFPEPAKSHALRQLVAKLGQADPAALSEWLAANPQPPEIMEAAAAWFVFRCDSENRSTDVA
jgi:hypothetical protein